MCDKHARRRHVEERQHVPLSESSSLANVGGSCSSGTIRLAAYPRMCRRIRFHALCETVSETEKAEAEGENWQGCSPEVGVRAQYSAEKCTVYVGKTGVGQLGPIGCFFISSHLRSKKLWSRL